MAKVINTKTKKEREVKNLGWLLRNWYKVERIEIQRKPLGRLYDCVLKAYCIHDKIYETDFASFKLCINWLDRPVFKTKKLIIISSDGNREGNYTIGGIDYKELKNSLLTVS